MNDFNRQETEFTDKKNSIICKLLEDAKRRLVETGTRNRLIHVNRENKRANALNIINEHSDDIYDILRVKKRKMRFMACGKDDEPEEGDTPLLEAINDEEEFDEARYTDNYLETPLGNDALQKRLLRLVRNSRTAEEEQGINILYLALGFLTWYEDKNSAVKRQAPLILLPVELVRNARTSTYDIKCRDDDLVANLPLQERFKDDFGIDIPEIDEDAENWRPSAYFEQIVPLIENRANWGVDENGMQLGFFSFAKLLMLRDLDPDNWPDGALVGNPLVDGLLVAGFETEASLFGKDDKLDEILEPADIIQVVDADASQTKVIEEVRAGRNLVVQGPPGTGKSQTITNIIAAAVHDKKRVLFVAEKMAALSVVYKRLVDSGLKDVCLELHSRNANKKTVLGELSRTLNAAGAVPGMPEQPENLKGIRDGLNRIEAALHKPIPETDCSAFEVMSQIIGFMGKGAAPPSLQNDDFAKILQPECNQITTQISSFADILASSGPIKAHPFNGVQNLSLQPTDIQRLEQMLSEALDALNVLTRQTEVCADSLKIKEILNLQEVNDTTELLKTISEVPAGGSSYVDILFDQAHRERLADGLQAGALWLADKTKLEGIFSPIAYDTPFAHLRSPIAKGTNSFFTRLGPAYRNSCKELATLTTVKLPKKAQERLTLVDNMLGVQKRRQSLLNEESFLKDCLGSFWRGEKTAFHELQQANQWLSRIKASSLSPNAEAIAKLADMPDLPKQMSTDLKEKALLAKNALQKVIDQLDLSLQDSLNVESLEDIPLANIELYFRCMAANTGQYGEWAKLCRMAKTLEDSGLKELVEKISSGSIKADKAKTEFLYARAEALWKKARHDNPVLDDMADMPRHEIVSKFQRLEKKRFKDVQTLIRAKHLEHLPTGAVGEMAVIRGEIGKKRAHKPIRKLISQAGEAMQRIKPVLLMSPISVAQFLPPGKAKFDLLVIDEASQVRPEDALGAIARADQIVVVGDQRQLPPTSFFDKITGNSSTDEEDEEDDPLGGVARATELESILSLCEARGLLRRMLEWHYRSRDPSLIQVSNAEFYDHSLVLPPSPLQNDDNYGFKLNRVNGAYSSQKRGSGRPQTNKIEAQAVVDAMAQHARDWPELSLGIVTFSVRQRNMITELLEHARRNDSKLDALLREGKSEDVFVKNIENVQGDERDVIFISVGYGPHEPGGQLASMSFGPINRDGGERRLNVLFSRSRVRCEVFTSFDPGDIDLSRTTKEGPRVLKRFLEFAKTGLLDERIATGLDADSPFEEDVADEIRNLGYTVDNQVGSGGFLIDLGVIHPNRNGQYMLAVECDGATYHSALWARERDRLRQGILEGLGWKFHRIWSTDWFHRRPQEIERLREALAAAKGSSEDGISVRGANVGSNLSEHEDTNTEGETIQDIPALEIKPITVPLYQRADIKVDSQQEPHEASLYQLADIVSQIVAFEGPIHQEEVARRLAAAFRKNKAGRRIVESTVHALRIAEQACDKDVLSEGAFWFTQAQKDTPPIRDRSNETGATLKASSFSPMEIRAAIKLITEQSGSVPQDELVRAVARILGFKRVGIELKHAIGGQIGGPVE